MRLENAITWLIPKLACRFLVGANSLPALAKTKKGAPPKRGSVAAGSTYACADRLRMAIPRDQPIGQAQGYEYATSHVEHDADGDRQNHCGAKARHSSNRSDGSAWAPYADGY